MAAGPYNAYPVAPFTIPDVADFNTSLSVLAGTTVTGDVYGIVQQDASSGTTLRFTYQAPPATPYTVTAGLDYLVTTAFQGYAGIAFRNSGTGRLVILVAANDSTEAVFRERWANLSTLNSTIGSRGLQGNRFNWFRMANDGTNITFSLSSNGLDWEVYPVPEALATWVVAVDQIGFLTRAGAASSYLRVASWEVL